ncbi:hypothetical protein KEM56_005303 [Ascosphaera pollenicola]|nr:hypothetical protein KEM56_005303 [Ascosphaera pollenicola]
MLKSKKSTIGTNDPHPATKHRTHVDTPVVKHTRQPTPGHQRLLQSKKVDNLISRFNEAKPRSPDGLTSNFNEPFYYREPSQSPEPPRSPPSVSASQSHSVCSEAEASPRTVEEFPREEIRRFSVEDVNKLPLFAADSPIPFANEHDEKRQ